MKNYSEMTILELEALWRAVKASKSEAVYGEGDDAERRHYTEMLAMISGEIQWKGRTAFLAEYPEHRPKMPDQGVSTPAKWVNMTPHPINVLTEAGASILSLPKGETISRSQESKTVLSPQPFPVQRVEYGAANLPEPVEGTGIIVSMLVARTNPDRTDLYFPGDVVRDKEGNIIGCKSLNVAW